MKVSTDVMQVLSNAECVGNSLKLVGQLDRALYTKTNKVLDAAGGNWNRKAGAHVFDQDAEDAMEQILLTGEVVLEKQVFGYFPTPENIVQRLIELAKISSDMLVLEPSAGQGAIAKELANISKVNCYEIQTKNIDALTALDLEATQADFLLVEPDPIYDRVVMNPPFAKQADIKHVTHALSFLKQGGLLVSVMSSSVTFRDNKLTSEFRDLITQKGGWIETLPEDAFKPSGTMVRTVIVVIPN